MFACAVDNHQSKPGQKRILVVTKTRLTRSENYVDYDPETDRCRKTTFGKGHEIVEEKPFCPDHLGQAPKVPEIVNARNPKTIKVYGRVAVIN